MRAPLIAVLLLAAIAISTCGRQSTFEAPFSSRDVPADDPFYNWAAPPREIEHRLAWEEFTVLGFEPISAGTTGARKALLRFADGWTSAVKWKEFPPELDGWNNSPRKEVAAYAVQKWFLSPQQYVVPTNAVRCVPTHEIDGPGPPRAPTVAGTRCVLVTLSTWLHNVRHPETLYQPNRFASDAAYAFHLANFNVLTTLIDNRDSRGSNVLVSDRAASGRVYSADNGMSFDPWFWKMFALPWNEIVVPAIPSSTVERLRAVSEHDYDGLAVLVQLLLDDSGVYRQIEAAGPPLDPDEGVRRHGRLLQLGLTREEIGEVARRARSIVERVDRGEIARF